MWKRERIKAGEYQNNKPTLEVLLPVLIKPRGE
jgi:hypothetical protein